MTQSDKIVQTKARYMVETDSGPHKGTQGPQLLFGGSYYWGSSGMSLVIRG